MNIQFNLTKTPFLILTILFCYEIQVWYEITEFSIIFYHSIPAKFLSNLIRYFIGITFSHLFKSVLFIFRRTAIWTLLFNPLWQYVANRTAFGVKTDVITIGMDFRTVTDAEDRLKTNAFLS